MIVENNNLPRSLISHGIGSQNHDVASRQIVLACVNNSDAQQISTMQQAFESDSQIET